MRSELFGLWSYVIEHQLAVGRDTAGSHTYTHTHTHTHTYTSYIIIIIIVIVMHATGF